MNCDYVLNEIKDAIAMMRDAKFDLEDKSNGKK